MFSVHFRTVRRSSGSVSDQTGFRQQQSVQCSEQSRRKKTRSATMQFSLGFCLFLAVTASVYAEEEIKLDEGVLVLTTANFKSAVADNEFILVEFCEYTSRTCTLYMGKVAICVMFRPSGLPSGRLPSVRIGISHSKCQDELHLGCQHCTWRVDCDVELIRTVISFRRNDVFLIKCSVSDLEATASARHVNPSRDVASYVFSMFIAGVRTSVYLYTSFLSVAFFHGLLNFDRSWAASDCR